MACRAVAMVRSESRILKASWPFTLGTISIFVAMVRSESRILKDKFGPRSLSGVSA